MQDQRETVLLMLRREVYERIGCHSGLIHFFETKKILNYKL